MTMLRALLSATMLICCAQLAFSFGSSPVGTNTEMDLGLCDTLLPQRRAWINGALRAMEQQGYTVYNGTQQWAAGEGNGNNPSSLYGVYGFPSPIGYNGGASSWHIPDEQDAILFLGCTPPTTSYISWRSYVNFRSVNGVTDQVFASLGDSVNDLRLNTTSTVSPFGATTAVITSADSGVDADIRQALAAAGFPSTAINSDIISPSIAKINSDIFIMLYRVATMWQNVTAGNLFVGQTYPVYYLKKNTAASGGNPWPVQPLIPRGDGWSEYPLYNSTLNELVDIVVQNFSSEWVLSDYSPLTSYILNGYVCLNETVQGIPAQCLGDNQDAEYDTSPLIARMGPAVNDSSQLNRFYMVVGINHVRSGKTTYDSMTVQVNVTSGTSTTNVGVAALNNLQYQDSGALYAPNLPQVQYTFAIQIARSCEIDGSPVGANSSNFCIPIPLSYLIKTPVITDQTASLNFPARAYLDPATKVGPLGDELVKPIILQFDRICPANQCQIPGNRLSNYLTLECSAPTDAPAGTSCDDGNPCTQDDVCSNGVCSGTPISCEAPSQCFGPGICNITTGTCNYEPLQDGTGCDDDNACTQNDQCTAGTCSGIVIPCASPTQCSAPGVCDSSTGLCSYQPLNGTTCNDGNACTQNDQCSIGVCTGTVVSCAAPSQCFASGVCDSSTGVCNYQPVPNGNVCNDGNACTQNDECTAGICSGTIVPCAAPGQCSAPGVCDSSTGECSYQPLNGTACNDGNACTRTDLCQAGSCLGTNPVQCPSIASCQRSDTCNPTTGLCSVTNLADGSTCTTSNVCQVNNSCHSGQCTGSSCSAQLVLDQQTCLYPANDKYFCFNPFSSIVQSPTSHISNSCPGSAGSPVIKVVGCSASLLGLPLPASDRLCVLSATSVCLKSVIGVVYQLNVSTTLGTCSTTYNSDLVFFAPFFLGQTFEQLFGPFVGLLFPHNRPSSCFTPTLELPLESGHEQLSVINITPQDSSPILWWLMAAVILTVVTVVAILRSRAAASKTQPACKSSVLVSSASASILQSVERGIRS